MNYDVIASEILSKVQMIEDSLSSIKSLKFDSTWQGDAHDKMCGDLEDTILEMEKQLDNLKKFANNLNDLDDYKNNKKSLDEIKLKYNSSFDELLKSEYKTKISALENQLNQMKRKIQSNLSYGSVISKIKVINYDVDQSYKNVVTSLNDDEVLKDAIFYSGNSKVELINGIPAGVYSKKAQQQEVYYNGKRLKEDDLLNMKVGQTIKLKVKMTDSCGKARWLQRTSADGQEGWEDYFDAYSDPFVNRYDKSTFLPIDTFNWVITAKRPSNGPIILSQTTYHSTDYTDHVKSMIRIRIKVSK